MKSPVRGNGATPMHEYQAFGLRWRSAPPLPLPPAPPMDVDGGEADVAIHLGRVPQALCQPAAERHIDTPQRKARWQACPGEFLMHVDSIGSIHIGHGRTVLAQPRAALEPFGRFMYRVLSAVVLQQRGLTPLHASANATDDGALLFLGPSGVGKSTLAATLATRGMPLLCDDLTAVGTASNGRVAAWPAFPGVRLWGEAVARLGPHQSPQLFGRAAKLYVPCAAHPTPLAVRAVYLLATSDTGARGGPAQAGFDIVRLSRAEAWRTLHDNILKLNYAAGLGCMRAHFGHLLALSGLAVYGVTRHGSQAGAGAKALAERIETHLGGC